MTFFCDFTCYISVLPVAILEFADVFGIMSSENGKAIYEGYQDRVAKLRASVSPQNIGIIVRAVTEITEKPGEFYLKQTVNDGTYS